MGHDLCVPDDLSYDQVVLNKWGSLVPRVLNGEDVSFDSDEIDDLIANGYETLGSGGLDDNYDWESDLRKAVRTNKYYRNWVDRTRGGLLDGSKAYLKSAAEMREFAERLGEKAIGFCFVAHGAIGLAALSAIAASKERRYELLVPGIGALVGIAILAFAIGLYVNYLPKYARQIEKIATWRWNYKKNRILEKIYKRVFEKVLFKISMIVYFCVIWLVFYSLIFCIIIF
ncbi:hypothetical protein [Breoghania sp.]|uniref:hypothetical protein n=1 Tax=Breoghania sp. TaxID=2065378 RepID=UPI002AAC2732|nr:hypothetical protein [Breoghania sp.]